MAETSPSSVREKFVAVFQSVLPSVGSGESLSLLLTSLESCLSNNATVFLAAHGEPAGERQRSHEFTVWVLAQLVLVQGDLPDGATRQRAAACAVRLLRTLHAREPVLLAGAVLPLWLSLLQQLTAPAAGGATLRLLEDSPLPPVERRLPVGTALPAFRDTVLGWLLCEEVLQLLVMSNCQLSAAVTCLGRLGRTGSRSAALRAVTSLVGERPASLRHRLLRARLLPPTPAPAEFTRLPPAAWRGAAVSRAASVTPPEQMALHMLSAIEESPVTGFSAVYRHAVDATECMLQWPVDVEVQKLLVTMLSLPWLGAEVGWLDLQPMAGRPEVRARLEAVISKLGPAAGSDVAEDCLRAVVMFPHCVCPLWRTKLIGKLCGQCEVSEELLPAAALSVGRSATGQLMAAVTSYSQLAPLGRLLCLSAGSASVCLVEEGAADPPADCIGLGKLQVHCAQCDWQLPPEGARRMSVATVPPAEVVAVIIGAVTSWERPVTSSEHRALVSCINHAEDRTAVVRAVLALANAAEWSPALSQVLCGGGDDDDRDWRPAQTLLFEWLASLDDEQCAHVLDSLLYRVQWMSPWVMAQVLAVLQRPLLCGQSAISATAHLCLQELARRSELPPSQLWLGHRAVVCAALAKHLLQSGAPLARLGAAAAAWEWRSLATLLQVGRRHLLPPLVVAMATAGRADLLDDAVATLETSPMDLLIDNYQYVMSHLVLSGRRADLGKLHAFIEKATGKDIAGIRRCSLQGQVSELVLGMHAHREDVIRELGCLAQLDDDGPPSGRPVPLETLVKYLSGRLLGVLGSADARLSSSVTSDEEKRLVLLSVGELCKLLGRAPVSAISRKMVATLKAGLSVRGVDHASVWVSMIRALDGPALRALASELLVTLAPLPPAERAPALKCLLTERAEDLADVLDELPDVDSLPQLGAVSLCNSQAPLADRLARSVRMLTHHSVLVRRHVLLDVRRLLAQHSKELNAMVRSAAGGQPTLGELMDALLAACRDADNDARRLVAECLGSLGAIDPARLTTADKVVNSAQPVPLAPIASDDFATELLTQLGRAYSAAPDGTSQAFASFAMQEVLKIYGVSGGGGAALWDSLPAELRQLLAPMRTSKYNVTTSQSRNPCLIVYGSADAAGGYSDWVGLWLTQLSSFVTQSQAAQVFNATRSVACRDVTLAAFLLPYVLVTAVIDGGDAAQRAALAEIEAVLRDQSPKSTETHRLCCRSVFAVLDAAAGWRLDRQAQCGNSSRLLDALRRDDTAFCAVSAFLERVPFDVVAEASRRCGGQKRALQSLELHLRRHPTELAARLPLLQALYVSLAEPDGVAGVSATRQEAPSVADQLVLHQSRGQLQDALSCYEHVCSTPGSELEGYRGLVSCYLSLDQPHSALGLARALAARSDAWQEEFGELLVEATWRLGQWDALEPALEDTPLTSWGAAVGATLLHADQKKKTEFEKMLSFCREQEMAPLCLATIEKGSYAREYEHLVRLHILSDMERALPSLLWEEGEPNTAAELATWQRRLDTVRPAVSSLEPVLTARRAVLTLARDRLRDRASSAADTLDLEIGRCWLRSARVSREAGQLQRAANCLLQMEPQERRLPEAFVERARLLWLRGDGDNAIRVLRQGVESHFPDWSANLKAGRLTTENRNILAEAKLLLARYCEESAHMDSSVINQHFLEVTEIRLDWEEVHFYTAKYLERLWAALPAVGRDSSQLAARVVHALGKSLQYGCRHVYESMPRLLSVWLDYGADVSNNKTNKRAVDAALVAKNMDMMCRRVGQLLQGLPLYCFLTSLPQIISRICHGRPEVYAQIRDILAALLATYPRQCMWSMLAVSRSSYPMRVERCQDVFARAKTKKPSLATFISDVSRLADKLVDLSNKPVDKKVSRLSMTAFFPSLRRLVTANFSQILVPLQQQMTVVLPETAAQHGTNFQPFPDDQVCIAGFEDELEVMPSLVKPKKITIRGTDGRKYTMMAKPKDDLRKDSRLMEFNRLVNRHLASDAEARSRSLRIRTYTVIPLNDECGLLQWVPNLSGMRQVLLTQYRRRGNVMTNAELKQVCPRLEDSLETKRKVLVEQLLPRHPPLLSQWLVDTFAEPQAWYTARLNYARTTAVMSMIGYILGLGDRHGENILLDASCGDCVHVDFNCLFNKGELFDWPERVPFRLTHNMVNALGPTGVEGVYRTACEVTMSVMRQQQDALMCVLRPFVHDPLVEWSKQERKTRDVGEIVNEKAQAHVGDIEQRLRGQVRSKLKPVPIPLSVAGQVNYLIEEATSVDNLCQMYIGWAAHF
ncbi:serine/threonine-protein kinase ATR-like [Amphibalanus amphitrite]|nr:serine/threonine-protein kinase ATR-like [Amphibalanus amphitrite]